MRGGARASAEAGAGDGREETAKERLDRNFEELTGELRVVITGVQVLLCGCLLLVATTLFGVFAGLLTVVLAVLPFAALWFAAPLLRRRKLDSES